MNETIATFPKQSMHDDSKPEPKLTGKVYENKLQFDEAVQRLLEEQTNITVHKKAFATDDLLVIKKYPGFVCF